MSEWTSGRFRLDRPLRGERRGLNAVKVQQDPRQPNPDAIPKNEFYKVSRFTGGLTGASVSRRGRR